MVDSKKSSPSASSSQPKKRRRAQGGSPSPSRSRKKTPVTPVIPPTKTLIVDNGGDTLKYGWSTDDAPEVLSNVTARLKHQITVLVGDELSKVQNPNSLIAITRSTERGVICNLANQTQVWKRMLDKLGVAVPSTSEAASSFGWKTARKLVTSTVPKIPSQSIAVVLLLPPNCPRTLLDQIIYIWMEDFGVARVGFGISSAFGAREHPVFRCSCTIDVGWSSTLVVPTFKNKPIDATTIRRCPIGGRHMINILKFYMSYRQYNLMDQEKILREVFERLCYLSLNFKDELRLARHLPQGKRVYDRDFILPDYQTIHRGEIRIPLALQREMERRKEDDNKEEDDDEDESSDEDFDDESADGGENDDNNQGADYDEEEEEETKEEKRNRLLKERAEKERLRKEQEQEEQILRVSVERFTVPEVIFSPQDAGMPSDLVGLAQAVVQAVNSCPEAFHPALYQSIFITGGVSKLPNLKTRLEQELRSLVSPDYSLKLEISDSPIIQAWLGTKHFIQKNPSMVQWSVGREEWDSSSSKRKLYSRLLVQNGGIYT